MKMHNLRFLKFETHPKLEFTIAKGTYLIKDGIILLKTSKKTLKN